MMKSMKLMNSRHSNTTTTTTSLARRALLLLTLFVMGVGNVWGATKVIDKYVQWDNISVQCSIEDITTQLGKDLATLKDAYYIKWYVVNSSEIAQDYAKGSSQVESKWSIAVKDNVWPYQENTSEKYIYLNNAVDFYNGDNLSTKATEWGLLKPTFYAPKGGTYNTFQDYPDYTIVCEASSKTTPSVPEVKYVWHFNATGLEPDDFVGTPGTEVSKVKFLSGTLTTTTIDFSDVLTKLPGVKYARYYLTLGGDAQDISSTAITVTGGTPETIKAKHGVYVYTGSDLTAENMSVTVTTTNPLVDYQVVGVFSDDDPDTYSGTTVTKEPSVLDYKYTYKFLNTDWQGTISASAFSHSKEVLLANESVASASLSLVNSLSKILSEYVKPSFSSLATSLHLRWYVVKNDGAGNYEMIANSEDYLAPDVSTYGHKTKEGFGLYWNTSTHGIGWTLGDHEADKVLNTTFTKPVGDNWEDYKVYVLMSDNLSGQTTSGTVLTKEPSDLNMVYIFSFFTEDAFQFVHDKGESGRDYYTQTDFTDAVQQYNWDNATSTKELVSEKIRQSVHTVEYDLYVDPTSTAPVELHLPFQKYSSTGDPLEPAAYIRWYDWKSDIKGNRLTGIGTLLEEGSEMNGGISVNRGLFFLNNSKKGVQPISSSIGATFNPNGLDELVTIACDVSKYYDGIYESSVMDTRSGFEAYKKPYLMHEPTLSTRYLFNIRPASIIATAIKIGKTNFEGVDIDSKFKLGEDNGRVCVQYNSSKTTEFSVRASLPTLDDYFFYDTDNTTIIQGAKIKWVPYYVDGTGKVWEWNNYQSVNSNRIQHISVASLTNTSTTSGYKNGSEYTAVTVGDGSIIHLVGYIYNSDESKSTPVIHYELFFRDAPAYQITNLSTHIERTEAYLSEHMTLQDVVNFDDDGNDCGLGVTATIDSQLDNHSTMPLAWDKAQYGFCYPDVRRIPVSNDDQNGISPIHGDYMILKSMNRVDISENDVTHIYKYHWYTNTAKLTDYTNTIGGQFGNFLYVDASDESRTIAKMKFTANLCAGSELCFTGAIADMTGGSGYIWPEVMATVYAVKKTTKKRVRVVSFHSSDLSTVADGSYSQGIWYQMYGSVPIPNNVDLTDIESYEVEIDNYALGTSGADYCVDQLMFYTSTGKMTVEQTGGMCLDDDLALTASMTAELLEHKILTLSSTPTKIYYRVFKRTSAEGVTPVTYEPYDDSSIYNNGGKDYGETTACKAVLNSDGSLDNSTAEKIEQNKGYYIEKGVLRFKVIDNKVFNLPQGDYFFALTNVLPFTGTPTTALSDWANPNDACDVFSNFFVPRKMGISFTKAGFVVSNVIGAGCGGGTPSVSDYKVMLKVPDASEASGFKTYDSETEHVTFTFYKGSTAAEALTKAKNATGAISSGTYTITYTPLSVGTNYFVAVPSNTTLSDSKTICTYIPFTFIVTNAGPALELGFNDVTYPSGYERVVRIGKEQLDNLKSNSYILHVPVQSFKDKNGNTANDILLEDYFTLYGTTDPLIAKAAGKTYEVETTTTKVAEFVNTKDSKPIVNTTYMYLPLNFANNAVTFHEGFEYKIHTTFCDVNDASDAGACHPDLYLIIKVVPEYVTWNDEGTTVTPNTNVGTNWSNDANWSRSSKAELYSTTYQDNTDINASLTSTPATYVPMKFTYVTIPTGNVAPKLKNLTKATNGLYNNIGATATTNIQYDMMVKVENECGHSISGDIYDCEKFYSNICKEIYFKPSAELINQQYLTYEKAWVEKELTSNTWYLMSTPLRDTYAGDMFVPLSATATKNGRQETEAFQAITFPDQADATYSRTKYPFYQHSWGSTFGSTVRVASNDNYRTDYSAKLQSSAVTETAFANWGHSFNDVQEPYTTRTAFAIRAHKKTQGTAALIRLPKTNTTYNYFDWKDTNPTVDPKTSGVKTITKDGYGKLLVDKDQNATQFEVDVATLQSVGGYVLVGNPYMASIDMTSFLAANSLTGYWTYEGSAVTAMTDGKIRPLQGFFVKKESGNITFTPAMMVDGNHATDTPAPAREFTMTATSNRGQSTASVSVGEEEKSVETLFDSNLEDVPMVYTVANGYAVSINQVKELNKPIAFGVNCSSQDKVEVTFSDIEQLTNDDVFVVDAVDGKTQQIFEGDTFSIQPNDYGRYFLVFANGTTGIETTLPKEDGTEGEKVIFDLQGRRVIYPGKGVYIVNGKKVLMK